MRLIGNYFFVWFVILIGFLCFSGHSLAQENGESDDLSVNGYLKYMNTIMDPPGDMLSFIGMPQGAWLNENMFHNRFDFRYLAG